MRSKPEANMFKTNVPTLQFVFTLLTLCLALCAGQAQASFHTYIINEIYSNADGTIQFIELKENSGAGGQNFLQGHTLVNTSGGVPKTLTFSTNLPNSNTANTSVLIATQAFANLGSVTPDYIIPAGFLSVTGGSLNYAGVDTVAYGALPANGQSINRSGVAQAATPKNFAGVSGSIPQSFAPEAGFWYNPAEGGRGYVIEIHGTTLFIGGFMYDAAGNAVWYASGPAAMVNATTYTSVWQQYGGGQTLTGTWHAANIVNANVGALTLQFSSATAGTLTLPNGSQIPITRFPF
jgi:hypothetical protein